VCVRVCVCVRACACVRVAASRTHRRPTRRRVEEEEEEEDEEEEEEKNKSFKLKGEIKSSQANLVVINTTPCVLVFTPHEGRRGDKKLK